MYGLRNLLKKDAPLMLEWMHDESVVEYMGANFAEKTLQDCENFIESTKGKIQELEDVHLAVVDEKDEYMGTVSLKHIDHAMKIAEFAISMRSCSMGKGMSAYGMKEILRIGKEELDLDHIYWCVNENNKRAIRFYDKNGFLKTNEVPESILEKYTRNQLDTFLWYEV